MLQRIVMSIPMIAVALAALWLGGVYFAALLGAVALGCAYEWQRLTNNQPYALFWNLVGVGYIGLAVYALFVFRGVETPRAESGLHFTLFLFVVVWATDIGAYFSGKAIGGPKIWPRISPKKTWAGLIGGMLAACLAGAVHSYLVQTVIWPHAALAMVFAVVAQVGDFFESWLKRRANIKDSGSILPGHGGLLDRVDGLLAVAPVALLLWYLRPMMG